MIEELDVGEPFGTSDHQIVRCKLIVSKNGEILDSKKMLNYFKADYNDIREKLKDTVWIEHQNERNIEENWNSIKSKLEEIKDKFIPLKRKTRGKCSWSTRETKKCRRAKVKAWNKFRKLGNEDAYQKYKIKLNKATAANKNAQRNFEKKLATDNKDNSKSFFAYVRSKQRTRDKVGPLKDKLGKIIVDDQQGADLLNEYFCSVFTKENLENIPQPDLKFKGTEKEKLLDLVISEDDVLKKLAKLRVDKSPGVDNIHPKLLFELRHELAEPIAELFNKTEPR